MRVSYLLAILVICIALLGAHAQEKSQTSGTEVKKEAVQVSLSFFMMCIGGGYIYKKGYILWAAYEERLRGERRERG